MKNNWPTNPSSRAKLTTGHRKLGEVCEISAGGSAPQGARFFENGKHPFFRTSDVGAMHLSDKLCDVRDYLNDEGIKKLNLFKKGTILFPKSGASTFLNHRVVMGCNGYVSSHLATISAGEKIDYKYLYFFLILIDAKNIAPNSSYPSLRIADIAKIEIPLPPLSEQKKIVAKLERVLAKINSAKKLRAEARENADNLLPAELHKIFDEGKKKGWEEKELQKVVEQKTAKNTKRNLPFVGMEDVESETGKFLGSLEPRSVKSTTFYFDKESVLYGKLRPYLNKVLLPDFEGHCSTEFIPLKPKDGVSRKWIAYWLKSPQIVDGAMSTNTGSRMPRANMKDLMKFKILLPSLAEQKEIVKHLDSLSLKLQKLQKYQKSTQSDLLTFEQAILHKAFL